MNARYQVTLNATSATIERRFSDTLCLLQDTPTWAAETYAASGEQEWKVKVARLFCRILPSRIYSDLDTQFYAWGRILNNEDIVYQIQRIDDRTTRITPATWMAPWERVILITALLCFGIFPIVLFPLVKQGVENHIARSSRLYLDSLCRWLENQLPEISQGEK